MDQIRKVKTSDKRSVRTKLEKILNSIQAMNARITNVEESVKDINKHIETLDKKLIKRCDELEIKSIGKLTWHYSFH